jgi:IclR family transcriptional regulator, acetate operon repressor
MTKTTQALDADGQDDSVERATSPMESVDKALQALDLLSTATGDGMQLGALANALGLKKNSLHRTLSALRYRGFVVQDGETGNYQLGPSLLRLADNYMSEGRLRVLFHSILGEICAEVNELCHLGILDGTDIVYMDKVEPEQSIRVWSAVGRRNPAVSTALGRAIIAFSYRDFGDFAAKFDGEIPPKTRHTLVDLRDIWAEIQVTRLRGYATENQEGQEGVSCVAFPVLRRGQPIFAISVVAPFERMNGGRINEIVATVRRLVTPRLPVGLALAAPQSMEQAEQPKPRGRRAAA